MPPPPIERLRAVPVEKAERNRPTDPELSDLTPPPSVFDIPPPPTRPDTESRVLLAQTLGVIAAIAGLTSSRILLLLAVVGAFWLANTAISLQSTASLLVLIAYCLLTVVPLTALDLLARRRLP